MKKFPYLVKICSIFETEMDRNKNISLVIRRLLAEHPDAVSYTIPTSLDEQQYMLRALLNVRPPEPADDELLATQDLELHAQLADKGIVKIEDIASSQLDKRLYLWQGDITRLQVDAIVNAANSALLGCFVPNHRCIDNAIHSAAGIQLRLACQELMAKQGYPEPTGKAKITPGFNLPSRYVLHTVGPIVRGGAPSKKQCEELANCYRECLKLADENGLQSVAFCCISTGVFGFPQEPAASIALSTVREYLDKTPGTLIHAVIFNVFKDEDYEIYQRLLLR
jgi:O-acetyl-ADP-ribose deacetylase (regulator of RNase III)